MATEFNVVVKHNRNNCCKAVVDGIVQHSSNFVMMDMDVQKNKTTILINSDIVSLALAHKALSHAMMELTEGLTLEQYAAIDSIYDTEECKIEKD